MFERAIELVDDTPALVVDWAVVERNVEKMARVADERDVRLRPHMKTHKLIPLAQLQMRSGAVGLTVAKLGEAAVMIRGGVRNLLVAYPVVGETHVRRLLDLAAEADLAVALDSWEVAEPIAREAKRRSRAVTVLVEIDTGLHRVGVASGAPAVQLASRIADTPGLVLGGLMTHEGHAYAAPTPEVIRDLTVEAGKAMKATADELAGAGLVADVVSMGSSGTARFGIGLDGINEFRPGTYVFNDRTQIALGACRIEDCAAVVVATVVSRAQPGEAVVDAGSKTLTSDRLLIASPVPTHGQVANDPDCQVIRMSEEHAVLGGGATSALAVGDRVAILPNHICPVVNLFDRVKVLGAGGELEEWPVDARGM